jgi:hypothetical protein
MDMLRISISGLTRYFRCARAWLETEIGLDRFETAVRARGLHPIEAGSQLVAICRAGPIHLRS